MMKRFFRWAACALLVVSSGLATAEDPCDLSCDAACSSLARGMRSCGSCRTGLYAGVEATYLAPLYDESSATFSLTDVIAPATITTLADFGTAEELTGAPRIVLGYVGQRGIGVQLRYWELNNATSRNNLPDPILGNQIQVLGGEDRFNAYTIDLELTKEFCRRGWDLLGTFGVRHGNIDHSRIERVTGFVNGDAFNLGAQTREDFHGTGLTFSLSGLKPISRCHGLSFYSSLRGSTLWGPAGTTAITTSTFSGPGGVGGSNNGAIVTEDETMFIGELGAGLQWSRCVSSFQSRMFGRVGVEYQYWGTSDAQAIAQSSSGTVGVSDGTVRAVGGEQSTNLIGLAVMTGFAW
jgi:hypothetical protein